MDGSVTEFSPISIAAETHNIKADAILGTTCASGTKSATTVNRPRSRMSLPRSRRRL